jgi:hypothetical protein
MDLVKDSAPKSQSILDVTLKARQKFNGEIEKVVVPFEREEDMVLLCLSIFLHDFIHDYNLASMHKRIFKGEVDTGNKDEEGKKIKVKTYDLLMNLNIGIINPVYKIYCYESGGYGEVNLYDDNQFEDNRLVGKSRTFLDYTEQFEEMIPSLGGIPASVHKKRFVSSSSRVTRRPIRMPMNGIRQSGRTLRNKHRRPISSSAIDNKKRNQMYIDSLRSQTTYAPTKPSLVEKPETNAKTETDVKWQSAYDYFENNADFLGFYSALTTFVVTYLDFDLDQEPTSSSEKLEGAALQNYAMYNFILNSMRLLSYNLKNSEEGTVENMFFGDIFTVLKKAFVTVYSEDFLVDPLILLNSPLMLKKFVAFYVLFLNSKDMDEFDSRAISKEILGGDGTPPVNDDQEVEEELFTQPERVRENVPGRESVIRIHNNLITTLTRGMFIKLGIWDKIFPDPVESTAKYVFSAESLSKISYETLKRLYPIDPNAGGHINNELLIMQILIMKPMLLEMPPSKTLTFGSKIDDNLKNYLDVFYNTYFLKNQRTEKPKVELDAEVLENPDISVLGEESFLFFEDNASEDGDEPEAFGEFMDGGENPDNIWGDIELKEFPMRERNEDSLGIENVSMREEPDVSAPEEFKRPPLPPAKPIILKNLKKMYQNNVYTIQNLKESKIPEIDVGGNLVTNLYDLLYYNSTLMHRINGGFNVPAPLLKFVVNNAANIGSNLNGSKFLYSKKDREHASSIVNEIYDTVQTNATDSKLLELSDEYDEILSELAELEAKEKTLKNLKRRNGNRLSDRKQNEFIMLQYEIKVLRNTRLVPCENKLYLLKTFIAFNRESPEKAISWLDEWKNKHMDWINDCQAFFGLYRNLVRGTFCPTVSMMDAMFNCSIKYGATETKEVGTSNYELVYQLVDPETQEIIKKISYGGVVLNYSEDVNGTKQLNAKIDFDLVCIDRERNLNDVANISTVGMQVAESHDLKASVVYKCIVDKIREIYVDTYNKLPESESAESEGIDATDPLATKEFLKKKINRMWSNMQYYVSPANYNALLGATAIKTFGDYLQECLACIQWGGYVNSTNQFSDKVNTFIELNNITPIYRSVSEANKIVPYDENGNALRLGVQGDRPSGFRSIYILLNGKEGVNQHAMSGYVFTAGNQKTSRTILVSRNSSTLDNRNETQNEDAGNIDIFGKVVFVTRELHVEKKQKEDFLKSLQTKIIREARMFKDPTTGMQFQPEVPEVVIEGSLHDAKYKQPKPEYVKILEPNYDDWTDYESEPVVTYLKSKPDSKGESSSGVSSGDELLVPGKTISRKKGKAKKGVSVIDEKVALAEELADLSGGTRKKKKLLKRTNYSKKRRINRPSR